jgi:hypothetical protein
MKRMFKMFGKVLTALVIIVIGVSIAWGMQTGAKQLPLRQYFGRSYTNAIWDWSNPTNKTTKNLDDMSNYMYLHQLNTVYVDVSGYLAIAANPNAAQKAASQKQFETSLDRYISTLSKEHIKVYAAAGDVSWSNTQERHIPLSIVDFVASYNQTHAKAKFAGVEFDIESYNQPGFETASNTVKALVLSDYLDTVNAIATKVTNYDHKGQNLALGFTIPYWYDNENGNIPQVTWQEKTGPTLYHLLDRLNSVPRSNVVVMSYRNASAGNDGVIAHSRTEIDYAEAKAPNVKVLIGQEVNDVQPTKTTYYGESLADLSTQVKAFEDEFQTSGVFGGVAVNDYAGMLNMQDE